MIASESKSFQKASMRPLLKIAALLLLPGLPLLRAQELPQQPPEPVFDPYRAEKALEIGQFYLKKGNYDAAIERLREAARYKPNFARPYLLLGRAYEKKRDKQEAIQAYRKYLEILPSAPDATKVRKRINKLTLELTRAARRRSR